jgi:hypothetical protein
MLDVVKDSRHNHCDLVHLLDHVTPSLTGRNTDQFAPYDTELGWTQFGEDLENQEPLDGERLYN